MSQRERKKILSTVLEADVQGGASDPRPDIFQRVSKFQSTSPKLMWFVDHVRISGASAQSLGVDTRSPNGDDHWWDTHVKREKRNKRRHTANFISTSSFPLLDHAPRGAFFIDVELIIRYDRSASSPFFPFFTFDRSSSSKRRTSINCSKHVLKFKKKQKHQT